ncbi:MAG: hypothetical protein IMZ53_08435 [Thermoplasmata archaeon]|nr:hypothetical protein [Thermoplasmata archaeon]MBE3140596.1 hypothetical protein [Thermoplasmata archaeon]
MDARICHKKGGEWLQKMHLCNFKKMKSPSFSSIKWENTHPTKLREVPFKIDDSHAIAKGTASDLLGDYHLKEFIKNAGNRKVLMLRISGEPIVYNEESNVLKLGSSLYTREFVYRILEELIGEKILMKQVSSKGERKIAKNVMERMVAYESLQSPEKDSPLIIEGNRGYYILMHRLGDE